MRKLKLLIAACALTLGAGQTWAQTDVTSTYLTNAGFETSPIFDGTSLGASGTNATPTDGSTLISGAYNVYEISGWTNMTTETSDFARVFTMPYNTTLYVRGNNSAGGQAVAAPANGSSVTENNNFLLFVEANWCQNAILGVKQTANLPVGVYKLTFDTYVTTTVDNAMSLCGVKIGDLTTYKWPTAVNTWTSNEIYFTLDVATDVEFSMGYKKLGNVGGGSSAFLFIDNLKLIQVINTAAAAPTDVTSKIANADASAAWGSPWAHSGDLQDNRNTNNGYDGLSGFFEPSKWGSNSWGGTMYTDLTGLENGLYTLKAAVQSETGVHTRLIAGTSNSAEYPANGTANGTIASDGSVVAAGSGVDGWNFGSTSAWVTDGTLRIGVYTAAWAQKKWTNIDNFTLMYIPASEFISVSEYQDILSGLKNQASGLLLNSEYTNVTGTERTALTAASELSPAANKSELEAAISQAESAIADFTAAKTNYDALVAEIAKAKELGIATATADGYAATPTSTAATALTNTQNLKVAEYEYVTTTYKYGVALGEWTSTGTNTEAADFTGEHWSGDSSHKYKNQKDDWGNPKQGYAADSWSINFNQDVTLPKGNYVFKVAGRQASGDKVNTSLVVKNGDTEIGSVSDFPRSNSSRGIAMNGATKFEGENSEFANDGKGYGWEWRYVKFTLASDATVNIAISSVATAASQWVSFGDYTVQTDNEANIALITYNIALNNATITLANTEYAAVTGEEKTNLQVAINADGTLDKTSKTDIEAATTTLNNAVTAFTAAKSHYEAYVAAKDVVYPTLSYATATKRTALDNAQSAAAATSASDADTKTAAILTAARQYYESHALAENVTGAENKTDLISNPNFADVTVSGTTAGGWTFDQTGGNAQVTSSESFTDGSDNSSYSYFDYYNGSNNNQNIHQVISDLAPGRYMLTATGRGHSNFNGNLQLYVVGKGDVKIPAIGNTGGVFNRGWNDASLEFYQTETANVTIGAKTNNSKPQWWGVTRFRLVRLGDAAEKVTVSSAGFATYVPSYALNFSSTEIKAYKVKVTEKGVAKLTKVDEVPADTPVLLHKDGGKTEEAIPMMTGAAAVTENDLVAGTGAAVPTNDGEGNTNMILNNVDDKIGFYFAAGQTVAKGRAYLHISTDFAPPAAGSGDARMTMVFADEIQGISAVGAAESTAEGYYNLSGQRVAQPSKGLYIVNGKKVIIK